MTDYSSGSLGASTPRRRSPLVAPFSGRQAGALLESTAEGGLGFIPDLGCDGRNVRIAVGKPRCRHLQAPFLEVLHRWAANHGRSSDPPKMNATRRLPWR